MRTDRIAEQIGSIKRQIGQVIVGKESTVDLLLSCLFAGGHALLEDVPGTGKTLLAKTFSRTLDFEFRRIQFTPDLLPSDLSGINFFNPKTGDFEFRPGPVFANLLLADEINRATPRTQSSLLECMEERQITIDGITYPLEPPFFVIATQNPVDNQGTFPLPEAQMDRFMMRIRMGYPSSAEAVDILARFKGDDPLARLSPLADRAAVTEIANTAAGVMVGDDLLNYIVRLAEATRAHPDAALGVSPRGTQALLRAAQAYALVQGRDYVLPDDIKALVPPVWAHRILLRHQLHGRGGDRAEEILARLLAETEVPAEPAGSWGRG